MSTNGIPEFPPDPLTEILPEVPEGTPPDSLIPVFDDLLSEQTARRLPEVFDEFGAIEALKAEEDDPPVPIGRTWVWDFERGRLATDGTAPLRSSSSEEVVIRQWIRRCLSTERYAYIIYPSWFGVGLEPITTGDLSGRSVSDYLIEEVRSALLQHDRISEVEDIQVSEQTGILVISCTVLLDRGRVLSVEERLREV